ncbi:hypothetical protein SAMN05518849_114128 [Sphingobium sp. AP50]|uniref:hypothetical protein n=1 Tax=Sphingobium sp. AP50 TaxID=1884369 RepID=UPI0008B1BC57|nr:hypothetical protein [Sphingobium sp. AP50]SEJ82103.1 hypothetical protein SAMN05518849_114128 [Sphingobium sp. AP50]
MRTLCDQVAKYGPSASVIAIVLGVALFSGLLAYRIVEDPVWTVIISAMVTVTLVSVTAPRSEARKGGHGRA